MECSIWGYSTWSNLPVHILIHIFSFLNRHDQLQAALTCKNWHQAFASPANWRRFNFGFFAPEHKKQVECVEKHGKHLRFVDIRLDQFESINRENACFVLKSLANVEHRLEKLSIRCLGRNPLFYAGLEFVEALQELASSIPKNGKSKNTLNHLDLSGLPVLLDDILFEILAENHQGLEYLNIQNSPLVCKVTPSCILHLVKQCRRLKDLRLLNCSLSEEILTALAAGNRSPLRHLAITCRREEKYAKDISSGIWKNLATSLPKLRITLHFDHTCPLHKIAQILQPDIPCSILRLETFTFIHDEIKQAAMYYNQTLEEVVVQTRPSRELNQAILQLSDMCPKLLAIHVFCILDKETVECVLEKHPEMKVCGTYTLRHEVGPDGLWVSNDQVFVPRNSDNLSSSSPANQMT